MVKLIFLILSIVSFSYACSGDCLSCHPVLKDSLNTNHHKILNSCITCHKDLSNVATMNECGGDCFACHSKQKLSIGQLPQHQALSSCKECHIDKEELLKFGNKDFSSNLVDVLK